MDKNKWQEIWNNILKEYHVNKNGLLYNKINESFDFFVNNVEFLKYLINVNNNIDIAIAFGFNGINYCNNKHFNDNYKNGIELIYPYLEMNYNDTQRIITILLKMNNCPLYKHIPYNCVDIINKIIKLFESKSCSYLTFYDYSDRYDEYIVRFIKFEKNTDVYPYDVLMIRFCSHLLRLLDCYGYIM